MITHAARFLFSMWLLYGVWCGNRWAIAVAITLVYVHTELVAYVLKRQARTNDRLAQFRQLFKNLAGGPRK